MLRQCPTQYKEAERCFRRSVSDESRPLNHAYVLKYLGLLGEALTNCIPKPSKTVFKNIHKHLQEIAASYENVTILSNVTDLTTQLNRKALK